MERGNFPSRIHEGASDLINTCPYCGFTPLSGKLVCPECGHEIEENIAHKLQDIDKKNRKNNDSIAWNEFQDVSLGALMNHLENSGGSTEDDAKDVKDAKDSVETKDTVSKEAELEAFTVAEKESSEASLEDDETGELESNANADADNVNHLEDNPILSAYIKRHREGSDDQGPSLEELVAAQQAANSETSSPEPISEAENEKQETANDEVTSEDPTALQDSSALQKNVVTDEKTTPEAKETTEVHSEEADELVVSAAETTNENQPDTDEELSKDGQWDEDASAKEADENPNENSEEVPEAQTEATDLQAENLAVDEETKAEVAEAGGISTLTEEPAKASEEATIEPAKEREPVLATEANEEIKTQETVEVAKESTLAPGTKKRQKWPLILAAAVVLAGSGGAYAYHQQQVAQEQKQAEAKAKALSAELADLKKSVASLYLNDDKEYLKADLTTTEVTSVLEQVEAFSDQTKTKDLKAELTDIQEKLALQDQVNSLYTKPVISGNELAKDVPIATTEKIDLEIEGSDPFDQLLAEGVRAAKDQLAQLNKVKAAMTPLVKDGKAVAEPKEAEYQAAQKLVAELVAGDEKTEFSKQLKLVETKINENKAAAKAAAEKAAQEKAAAEKAAQEQAAKEAAASTSNLPSAASPNMQTNSDNQPILATDAADVADSSNPAWTWSSGVLDKVLDTCIQRGYIVEGGYKLERVRIENGEGYYNLYATTNQAPLTANYKASDLPLYLVTINCKTGYFRGNGNDHTIR